MINGGIEISQKLFVATASDELLRLDRLFIRHGILDSRERVRLLIERGGVLLNDKPVTFPSKKIKEGDKVFLRHILLPPVLRNGEGLKIIHQDNDILVVHKPFGVLSLPEERESISVLSEVKGLLKGADKNIFPVHRLDKETSGVMIFARNRKMAVFLKREFRERRVEKKYIALLQGNLNKDSGIIKGIMRTSGEFGESTYRVIERLKYSTLVEISPKTGRTNQIRIQFSEIGHPLVGENKYIRLSRGPCIIFPRVVLHSLRISFVHPGNEKEVTFTAEISDDIQGLIESLKNKT